MGVFQERWYQEEAANAIYKDAIADSSCNPIIVAPTGSGKTPTLCKIIDLFLSNDPTENILVLSHDKRILKQNFATLESYFEGIEIGLYSSGLKSRTIKKITVAGIQSIHRRPEEFERFGRILVDECDLITIGQEGMYRKFFNALGDHQVLGLTATPFRTKHGYIHKGEGALFNKISYDLSSLENFNKLIEQGYLSELLSKPTALKLDIKGVKKQAGDFAKKDLSEKFDRESITEAAVIETIHYGKNYKKWLCFAIDIKHAEHIKARFLAHGIPAAVVHSKMEEDDSKVIEDFRAGKYRVLINVDMLTVGFDEPGIDLIIQMRPTESLRLYVQMSGRGSRIVYADGYDLTKKKGRLKAIKKGPKQHCLILDFAGNVARLGPINYLNVKQKKKKVGTGEAITKECPECTMLNHGSARRCVNCDFKFEFKEKIKGKAGNAEIIIKKGSKVPINGTAWLTVDEVQYSKHKNFKTQKESFLVRYRIGVRIIREYVNVEGAGYVKAFSKNWINFRWNGNKNNQPTTNHDLYIFQDSLKKPKEIYLDTRDEFPKILDARF